MRLIETFDFTNRSDLKMLMLERFLGPELVPHVLVIDA